MLLPKQFAGIFSPDPLLVEYTAWALRIFLAGGISIGFQISCQQAFVALGQAKISLVMACLRKLILLIPLIFILPLFFQTGADKAFAVFLAEPVSDFAAATVTTITFFAFFRKLLKKSPQV
jgi:Na+-driven multidrug efflux pump